MPKISGTPCIKAENTFRVIIVLAQVHVDIRLSENNISKSGEEPINAINQLAYIHDLAYQRSKNIKDRHRVN